MITELELCHVEECGNPTIEEGGMCVACEADYLAEAAYYKKLFTPAYIQATRPNPDAFGPCCGGGFRGGRCGQCGGYSR